MAKGHGELVDDVEKRANWDELGAILKSDDRGRERQGMCCQGQPRGGDTTKPKIELNLCWLCGRCRGVVEGHGRRGRRDESLGAGSGGSTGTSRGRDGQKV